MGKALALVFLILLWAVVSLGGLCVKAFEELEEDD